MNSNSTITTTTIIDDMTISETIIDTSEIINENIIDESLSTITKDNDKLPEVPPSTSSTPSTPSTPTIEIDEDSSGIFDNNKDNEAKLVNEKDEIEEYVNKELAGLDINAMNMFYLSNKIYEIVKKNPKVDSKDECDLAVSLSIKLLKQYKIFDDEELIDMKNAIVNNIKLIIDTARGNKNLNLKKKYKNKNKSLGIEDAVSVITSKIIDIIKEKKYTQINIVYELVPLTKKIMELIEEFPKLNGYDKKNVTLQIITKLVKTEIPNVITIDEKYQNILNKVIDSLPMTIDIIISLSRNKKKIIAKLKEIKNKYFKCCKCC